MNVEILGVGFENKGAELMLVAVLDALGEHVPGARLVAEVTHRNYKGISRYDVAKKLPVSRLGYPLTAVLDFLFGPLLRAFGVLRDKDVDIVLDCSGFAYGDHWGAAKMRLRLGRHLTRWRKQGRKLILLPQAFGPFTEAGFDELVHGVLATAELAYARDSESLAHLQAIGDFPSLRSCPDFTSLVSGATAAARADAVEGAIAIVVNRKMLSGPLEQAASDSYVLGLKYLLSAIARRAKRKILILLHETRDDLALVRYVELGSAEGYELIEEVDPKELKALIGRCHFIVSSRYHAVLSALNQGVPAITLGWSHKYEQLTEEWGYPRLLLDHASLNYQRDADALLDELLDSRKFESLSRGVLARAQELKTQSREMWVEVARVMLGEPASERDY